MKPDNPLTARKKFLPTLLRTLCGSLVFATFYFGLGWLFASRELGLFLAAWSVFAGPLLVAPLSWLYLRYGQKSLLPLPFAKEYPLAQEYLRGILHEPGPQPCLWRMATGSLVFFWFENPLRRKTRQEILVSEGWLRQAAPLKVQDWRAIWQRLNQNSLRMRRLRSWQILLWCGALSPLEIVVKILDASLHAFGIFPMEEIGFLLQKSVWTLKVLWFGEENDPGIVWTPQFLNKKENLERPRVLSSLLWGPWSFIPERLMHPLWRVLTHSNIILESGDTQHNERTNL